MSSQSSSSKTVAAILKQHQDLVAAKEMAASQQQHHLPPSQQNRKKAKQKPMHKPTHIINQLNSVNIVNLQSSNVTPVSQTMSRVICTSQQDDLFVGKDSKPAPATKASSLSRELSPSRITAQMQKVMPDPTAHQNLLLSALQGNMTEAMGIFSSTKAENIMIPTNSDMRNLAVHSSNSQMDPHQLTTTVFSNSLAPITVFSCPDDLEIKSKSPPSVSPTLPTVENILALSAGTIQTINVSHVPRGTVPTTSKCDIASSNSSSPNVSTRNALEVAEQIRMEANGQSTSAMRLGMQQQLLTQIKGSRSIDAQLASQQNPVAVSKSQMTQKVSSHDKDQKSLEVSMPLLAAKLAPSSVSGSTVGSSRSSFQLKQSAAVNEVPLLQPPVPSSSCSNAIVVPSCSMNKLSRKSPKMVDSGQFEETKKQLQLKKKSSQLAHGELPVSSAVDSISMAAVSAANDQMWALGQDSSRLGFSHVGAGGFDLHIKSGHNMRKNQHLDISKRTLSSSGSLERNSHADQSIKAEVQALSKADFAGHKLSWNPAPAVRAVNFDHKKTPPDKRVKSELEDHRLLNQQAALSMSKYVAGDSKQTAIDVDLDVPVGHLPSIVAEDVIQVSKTATGSGKKMFINSFSASAKDPYPSNSQFQLPGLGPTSTHSVSGVNLTPSTISLTKSLANSTAASVYSFSNNSSFSKSNMVMSSSSSSSSISSSLSSSLTGITTCHTNSSLRLPAYESPPPPYPHPAPSFSSGHHQKSHSRATKDSNHNPFTFPTSGLTLVSDSSKHGFTTYSVSMANTSSAATNSGGPQPTPTADKRLSSGLQHKSHSDVTVMNRSQHRNQNPPSTDTIPRLIPEGRIKLEKDFQQFNHVDKIKAADEPQTIQPFNQRISNLSCFPVMNSTYRAAYRSHAVAVQRARAGSIMSTAKSLDVLRQNLQRSINKEITDIIKRYTDKFFEPALQNIRLNNNEGSLGNEHINYVCRQILEDAKAEYISMSDRRSVTPSDIPDNMSDCGSTSGRRTFLKRSRISDSDSERGSDGGFKRKAVKRKGRPPVHNSGRVTPSKTCKSGDHVKREGPKWDPARIKPETLFVMGARANKALGLGNTRGRLYIRHPDVFKYIGDQEDKLWLYEHNLMPATGGKAYMLLLEDIEELSRTDEYKDSPGLMMHECVGFTVQDWMIVKMKEQMNALRSDRKVGSYSFSSNESEDKDKKVLPFSSFAGSRIKEEVQFSPAGDPEDMEFLSAVDNDDDTQPSCAVSPYTVTGGYEDRASPSPSELEHIEEASPHHLFS